MSKILVGTSGYSYKGWNSRTIPNKTGFYTKGGTGSLKQYAEHFKFVELNATFYRIPSEKTVEKWVQETPDDFKFVVKVNKGITHTKKMTDWNNLFPQFYEVMALLGDKLEGFLIQLPPSFANTNRHSSVDKLTPLERLVSISEFNLEHYPGIDFFVEFRHPT